LKRKSKGTEETTKECNGVFHGLHCKPFTDKFIYDVLSVLSKTKVNIMDLLSQMLTDMISIDRLIWKDIQEDLRKSVNKVEVLRQHTFDPFLSEFVVESLDYILKFKRDYLKGLSAEDTKKISMGIVSVLIE